MRHAWYQPVIGRPQKQAGDGFLLSNVSLPICKVASETGPVETDPILKAVPREWRIRDQWMHSKDTMSNVFCKQLI